MFNGLLGVKHYNNTHMSPLFAATGACENVITTMIRAIHMGRRIRRDQFGPTLNRKIPVLSN